MLLAALLAASAAHATPAPQTAKPAPYLLAVDPRAELFAAVQAVSRAGEGATGELATPYERELLKTFGSFDKHAATKGLEDLEAAGVSAASLMESMLHLSAPPELKIEPNMSNEVLSRVGGRDRFERFVAALRDFSAKSRFPEFYTAQQGNYAGFLAAARRELETGVDPKSMGDYLGQPMPQRFRVLLSPAFHGDGFQLAMRWTPEEVSEVRALNARGEYGLGDFGSSLAHAMAASITRPLARKHAKELDALGRRPARGCSGSIPTWEGCLNEEVLRAVERRVMERKPREGPAPQMFLNLADFQHHEALVAELKAGYETDRARYPTLESFYPRLVAVVKRRLASKPSGEKAAAGASQDGAAN